MLPPRLPRISGLLPLTRFVDSMRYARDASEMPSERGLSADDACDTNMRQEYADSAKR